ncbi:hypothetical protein EUX98_g4255 [Antrodiella citrinella]|uniref:Uncharacterized protein n=1 Tax=Antrodiella citrinella TaxID=2447956 RepID=A0A4S4MWJ7_9APHY|nr:hypothetical protein EUX98_g4255 [Antrodiella citrinella]
MAQLPRIDPYDGSIAFDPWYTRFQGQLRQLAPGGLSPNGSMRVQANMVLRNCSPGVEGVLSSLETLMNKKTAATWKYWTITRFRAFVPAIKTQIEIERKGKEAARQGLWGYLQRAALITAFIAGIAAILLPFTAFLNLYLNMQMTKGKMTQEIATVIYLSLSSMVVVDADVGSVGSCLWSFVVTIVIAAGVGWMFGFVGAYVWYLFKESRRPSHSWEDGVS